MFGDKGLTIVPGVGVGHKDAGCLVTWHLDHILWLPVSTGSSFIYKFIFLPSKPDCLISLFISMGGRGSIPLLLQVITFGEGNGKPLQYSCLENPMDGGAWWATVHGVAKSRTQLSDFTFTFHFHTLEKEMATHSSVLAWRIPGTGKPDGLPSMGSHRVGHD